MLGVNHSDALFFQRQSSCLHVSTQMRMARAILMKNLLNSAAIRLWGHSADSKWSDSST